MVIAIPHGGLANRLRLMASAHRIAKELGRAFAFYWRPDRGCGCRFGDLFDSPFDEIDEAQLKAATPADYYHDKPNPQPEPGKHLIKVGSGISRFYRSPHIIIHSCAFVAFEDETFVGRNRGSPHWFRKEISAFHQRLRPVAEVAERVEQASQQLLTPQTVGVHVRRTDHQLSQRHSTDEKFVAHMDAMIEQDSGVRFFLATDCPETERRFQERFGPRVGVYPKRSERKVTTLKGLDRGTREGMQDALVDLLLLSRTRRILGSGASTFSWAAEYFSGEFGKVAVV